MPAGLCALFVAFVGCGNYHGGDADAGDDTVAKRELSGISNSEQVAAYAATVHPVVTLYCAGGCHDSGATGAPFLFASSSVDQAYSIVKEANKIDRRNPEQSRIVRRPSGDLHECGSDCARIGAEMLLAVQDWAALLDAGEEASGGPPYVPVIASETTAYSDGVKLGNGERFDRNLIAFYDFSEGSGETAFDTSSVAPAMDLRLRDATWMSSYGVEIHDFGLKADDIASKKLYDQIADPESGTGQYSVEMWIQNANTTQFNARMVNYSTENHMRNFSLEQRQYSYEARNRSTAAISDMSGQPSLVTATADRDAKETL